jgi:plastocyanin
MRAAYLLLFVLACGGGGEGGDKKTDAATVDGPPRDAAPDAPPDAPSSVVRVDPCPPDNQLAETVTTSNFVFTPANISINVNDIVKFAPEAIHNVIPHPTKPSDPGLRSGATGEVRCLQFTMTGTFNYRCQPHASMEGVVQVSN